MNLTILLDQVKSGTENLALLEPETATTFDLTYRAAYLGASIDAVEAQHQPLTPAQRGLVTAARRLVNSTLAIVEENAR